MPIPIEEEDSFTASSVLTSFPLNSNSTEATKLNGGLSQVILNRTNGNPSSNIDEGASNIPQVSTIISKDLVSRRLLLTIGVLVVITLTAILISLTFHWYFSVLEHGQPRLKYNHEKMKGLQPKLIGKVKNIWQMANRSVHENEARENLRNLSRNDRATCYSPLCVHTALNILESMEWRINPCDDFYAFACGGWVKRNPPEVATSITDHFAKINDRVIMATQKIIKGESSTASPTKGLQMARSFYKECSDVDQLERDGLGPIMKILEGNGGWPLLYGHAPDDTWTERWSFSWLKVTSMLQRLSISTIVALEIKQDTARPAENALFVVEPLFFLSREYLVQPQKYTRLLTAYKRFVVDVALELLEWRKQEEILNLGEMKVDNLRLEDMAETMIAFEVSLAKLVTPETTITSVETFWDLDHLQKETDSEWTNIQPLNKLDWKIFLNLVVNGSDVKIEQNEKILVHDLPYIKGLVKLLDRTPTETLANYLIWRLMAKFTTGSTKKLRQIHGRFYQDLYGEQKLMDRNNTCAMVINSKFTIAIGSEFVKDSFEGGLKREVEILAANVKVRMEELLGKQSFIPHLLQLAIRRKLASIKLCVGFPRSFSNDTYVERFYEDLDLGDEATRRNETYIQRYVKVTTWLFMKGLQVLRQPFDVECWGGNYWSFIGEAYAYYDTARNSINLPVGLLQSPFYYQRPTVPWYMNYGGIGTIIGHELTHSLNVEGWVRIKLVDELESLFECLISSYSETDIPELEGNSKMDGYRTRSENFADHIGLASAFWSYQQHIKGLRNLGGVGGMLDKDDGETGVSGGGEKGDGVEEEISLPGLQLFSSSQMFFISFANMWCDAKSKESLYDEVESSTHTPSKYRVLGALKNSKDFSQVWNCPSGSKMNPRRKCNLF